MYKELKKYIYKKIVPVIKVTNYLRWRFYLRYSKDICIVIGAGLTKYKGWFSTDIDTLDVTKESDFIKYFHRKKIKKVLAEHVLEHLSFNEIEAMLNNVYKYSDSDLVFRVAVPDGYHPDKDYISKVEPGGSGEGSYDHKHLFNYKSISNIFEKSGYKAKKIEYWDERGEFHSSYTEENGHIYRCFKNDPRNKDGKPNYTSLIVDFYKT